MRVVFFSTQPHDRRFFDQAAKQFSHELVFLESKLSTGTVPLAAGFDAVCAFVNDELSADVLRALSESGVTTIALRCAGFNNVDLLAAESLSMKVVRVPAYSPYSVAEHTVGLILALNRNIHRAYNRVRDGNFSLGGLLGFDLHGRTVGVIGTGKIGETFAKIMVGFGCRPLGYDLSPNKRCLELGMTYVDLPRLYAECDIISLHCPLTPETRHLINVSSIAQMKHGVMVINTSRGAVIDTKAVIDGLKAGRIGHLGIDVYEEEADVFFQDLSDEMIRDDTLARLLTFPNVLVTGHQAFFTEEALTGIAETTLQNLTEIEQLGMCANQVRSNLVRQT